MSERVSAREETVVGNGGVRTPLTALFLYNTIMKITKNIINV